MSIRVSSTPNKPKFRASCDTCFFAKVRCSKARPMCSRCLAFGSECKYSPSSRAGKPKPDSMASRDTILDSERSNVSSGNSYPAPWMNFDTESPTPCCLETHLSTSPTSEVDRQEKRCFISPGVMPAIEDQSSSEASSSRDSTDLYDPFLYWTHTPPTNITSPYLENIVHLQPNDMTNNSTSPSVAFWLDQTDFVHFPNFGPCNPRLRRLPNIFMDECFTKTKTCDCYSSCLQTLQTLHNFNAMTPSPSFNIILAANQKAMETCSASLNCQICNSQSGSSLRTMLLGTILERIMLIYQDTSKNYFGPTSGQESGFQPQPLTFGVYRVASEDVPWLELEIILRDLNKFKVLLIKFQDASIEVQSQEDVEMHSAVTKHLYQSLNITREDLKKHKQLCVGSVE